MDNIVLKKLALQRCRVHVSHLCTLMHLGNQGEKGDVDSLYSVFDSLNRELSLIETLMDDG